MTIEKAIEILNDLYCSNTSRRVAGKRAAIKLGIEALKRLQHDREWGAAVSRKPLPGETKT